MGRKKVDAFARFFVLPQTGHGLSGTNYSTDGDGKSIPTTPISNTFSRLNLLVDWVEKKAAPPMSVTVTAKDHSLPMCSYYVDFGTRPFRFIRIDAILNWN